MSLIPQCCGELRHKLFRIFYLTTTVAVPRNNNFHEKKNIIKKKKQCRVVIRATIDSRRKK